MGEKTKIFSYSVIIAALVTAVTWGSRYLFGYESVRKGFGVFGGTMKAVILAAVLWGILYALYKGLMYSCGRSRIVFTYAVTEFLFDGKRIYFTLSLLPLTALALFMCIFPESGTLIYLLTALYFSVWFAAANGAAFVLCLFTKDHPSLALKAAVLLFSAAGGGIGGHMGAVFSRGGERNVFFEYFLKVTFVIYLWAEIIIPLLMLILLRLNIVSDICWYNY